jgi:N-acetylglucosamine kinase-like BadF-type ATPase
VVVGEWAGDRARIAALSTVVVAAAEQGDEAAQGVVAEAGTELALLVAAVRGSLGVRAEEVLPVSYSGGVFRAAGVRAAFAAALGPGHALREPVHGPAVGAALLARRRALGTPL